ncbi:hypothetical protein [Kribbella sp. CA-294648]|uniref:hypothetical protein n=1 Tax=Kribbella sp. CA-294648 TaxID=3239948 RepID=UPI003D8C8200
MSDSESGEVLDFWPDPAPGAEPIGPVERTDPQAVLADWFEDTAALDDLVAELVAAYETVEDDDEGDDLARRPRNEDLAETTVETVRRYLYNRKVTPGRTDPRQVMNEWFYLPDAYEELSQPFTMLTVVFQAPWGSTTTELAQDAVDAIQRYLLERAEQADG